MKARLVLIAIGIGFCAYNWGHAAWIGAKAEVAQALLARAWSASLENNRAHPPWPWADTHPVARLTVPRLGVDQIVLAGASGRTLAFGPGRLPAGGAHGPSGTVILAGHRDTHFAFLQQLKSGDAIQLAARDGRVHRYRVTGSTVVDARTTRLSLERDDVLVLSTCYPFDAIIPGGPLRYVVFAERFGTEASARSPGVVGAPVRARSVADAVFVGAPARAR